MSTIDPVQEPTDRSTDDRLSTTRWDGEAFRELVDSIHDALHNVATIGDQLRMEAEADAARIRGEAERVLAEARFEATRLMADARNDVRRALEGVERALASGDAMQRSHDNANVTMTDDVDPGLPVSDPDSTTSMSNVVEPPPRPASA
jgi:hypothetical protein